MSTATAEVPVDPALRTVDVTFRLRRFNPEVDGEPHWEDYVVACLPTDRVLTVLQKIKDEIDGTLTFRRSCGHGICGSDAMRINGRNRLACKTLVKELGYHAAIDYRNEDVEARLRELAPQGIDVFFDNVGGDVLDAVLLNIKEGTRVVICGAISQYDNMADVRGPRNYLKLAERHAVMAGFAVFHFTDAYEEGETRLADWFIDGSLVMPEHIEVGVERFPAALDILMSGGHTGKLLVKVSS